MLQKGQDFDALPPSFIIFICPYDAFKDNQRIYTFKKRCLQNLELELNDEATVMVLNTLGTKGTISKDLQSFYDYVNNNIVSSDFTKNIAETIVKLKQDKKVRLAYMTYETHLRDAQYEAEAKGKLEATYKNLKSLIVNGKFSVDKAMDLLNTPTEDRQFYKDLLAKGM